MRNKEDFELDLGLYLAKEKELSPEDKRRLLMAIFEKQLILNSSDFKVDYFDFQKVRGDTINMLATANTRIKMDRKELSDQEVAHVFLLENFISFLNSKGALKRMPKLIKE